MILFLLVAIKIIDRFLIRIRIKERGSRESLTNQGENESQIVKPLQYGMIICRSDSKKADRSRLARLSPAESLVAKPRWRLWWGKYDGKHGKQKSVAQSDGEIRGIVTFNYFEKRSFHDEISLPLHLVKSPKVIL